jgi:hypothetical protein
VSERIKKVFDVLRVKMCFEVTLRKIGKREAKLLPIIPSTGEPEDMIDEVPLIKEPNTIGPYYELVMENQSGYAPGAEVTSVCQGCGRESVNVENRRLIMTPSMWSGAHIFFLATTLHIVATDDLKIALSRLKPTNVRFSEI